MCISHHNRKKKKNNRCYKTQIFCAYMMVLKFFKEKSINTPYNLYIWSKNKRYRKIHQRAPTSPNLKEIKKKRLQPAEH